MAAQKLRFLYDNLCTRHPFVQALAEEVGYPAANLTSWRYDERWRAPWTRNVLARLGLNWDFQEWTAGTSSAPDDWTLTGAGASVARSTSSVQVPPYSASVTRAGADTTLELDLSTYVASYRWQEVTLGLWVNSASTNTRIYITDDTGTTTQAHGGAGDEFLQVTRTLDGGATLKLGIELHTSNHTAIADGAIFVLGAVAPETPDAPEAMTLDFHHNDYPVPNWLLTAWSGGPEAAPDGWVLESGAVRRSNTKAVAGFYSMSLVRSGTDAVCRYRFSASQLAAAKGKAVGFGGHTWASVASRATWALVVIGRDGASEVRVDAGLHSGGSSWEWDAAESAVIPHDATAIELRAVVQTGNTQAWFDAPAVRIGGAVTQTPHAKTVDAFALSGHNCGTVGAAILVEGSDDNFATTDTLVASFTPTTDKTLWKPVTSDSHKSHRITVSGANGQVELGVVGLGEYSEVPEVLLDWSHDTRVIEADEPVNLGGIPMESETKRVPVPRQIKMLYVEESWTGGELQTFLDHAGGAYLGEMRKRPFFVLPEGGDHPADAFLMWLTNQTIESVWGFGRRTDTLVLIVLAVGE